MHGASSFKEKRRARQNHRCDDQDIFYVSPKQTADECMAQMTDKRIRHLPVVEDGKLVGVISIGDLVKTVISQQKDLINSLENYITGKDYNR